MPGMCWALYAHDLICFHNRLTGRYHYYRHLVDEETETQRNEETCQGHGAVQWGDRFELR